MCSRFIKMRVFKEDTGVLVENIWQYYVVRLWLRQQKKKKKLASVYFTISFNVRTKMFVFCLGGSRARSK